MMFLPRNRKFLICVVVFGFRGGLTPDDAKSIEDLLKSKFNFHFDGTVHGSEGAGRWWKILDYDIRKRSGFGE
jgi:hypothetical protein